MGRHSGDQLAARPAVALALARSPQVFLAVAFTDELDALDIYAVHRAELCSYLWVRTRDGMEWRLGLSDEMTGIVDTGRRLSDDDLLARALASQPDVVDAIQDGKDGCEVRTARPLPADEMLALLIDAISDAHRQLARRRGIHDPDHHDNLTNRKISARDAFPRESQAILTALGQFRVDAEQAGAR